MPDSICTTSPTHGHWAWRSTAGAGFFLCLLATVLLACGHASSSLSETRPGGERFRRELAARLLVIDLRHEQLRQWVTTSSIAGKEDRLAASDEVRRHIALVTELLKRAGEQNFRDDDLLREAQVGTDLAGLAYDFMRTDVQATVRGMPGAVRSECNFGLELIWQGTRGMRSSPTWAVEDPDRVDELLERAASHRDNVMAVAPVANIMKVGVAAANVTSSAISLAQLTKVGLQTLARLVEWMRGLQIQAGFLELAGSGAGALRIQVVSAAGALTLTDTEVIALASVGQLSASALSLYMMANGLPPKLPDPKAFGDWAKRAPKRAPQSPDRDFTQYQIKQAGPEESLVEASTGEKVWADGTRAEDAHLLEAKFAGKPEISPYIEGSACEPQFRQMIRERIAKEFRAYAAVIRDPKTPAVGLEVITNDARAVPFFEALLRELGLPGRVVVRP